VASGYGTSGTDRMTLVRTLVTKPLRHGWAELIAPRPI